MAFIPLTVLKLYLIAYRTDQRSLDMNANFVLHPLLFPHKSSML